MPRHFAPAPVPPSFIGRWHLLVTAAWVVFCVIVVVRISGRAADSLGAEEDIRYIHREGLHILDGENPYSRIARSDMEHNEKYATYLPGIYLATAATQAMGMREFPDWLRFWRVVCAVFWAGTGALLFAAVYGGQQRRLVAALAASALWLFNRWSLHVLFIAHTDFVAVFFFVLCALLLARRPRWACLALGVSLSVKHIAILAVPALLIALWRSVPAARRRSEIAWAMAAMAAVPLAVSIPFLIADAPAFVQSMLFSMTREGRVHLDLWSVDRVLRWNNAPGRIPMLLLVAAATWLFARRQVALHAALLLVMLAFVWFNSVFFRQYAVWPIPCALLVAFARPPTAPSVAPLPPG